MRTTEENRIGGLQKELRTRLYETGLQVQVMNAGKQDQVRRTIDGICELIGFAKLTTIEEEKTLFPSLAISAPFMVSLLEQEQMRMHEISEKLCISIEQWENSISVREKQRLAIMIQFGYNDWMANLLQYLNKQQLLHISAETEAAETLLEVVAA
ncbi:MAG TPA: hypothetical protein VK166_07025 [Chitinophagaceae bacterium]|nr:hypothetical protein [Chitinophagaceae bacterium]